MQLIDVLDERIIDLNAEAANKKAEGCRLYRRCGGLQEGYLSARE